MAITVHIFYEGTHAKDFAREMTASGIVHDIRAEEGNLRYEDFLPMDRDDAVLLIDSWADQAALDRHHHTPMMERIIELREKYDLHMKVERYVSDEEGIPRQDKDFIRD